MQNGSKSTGTEVFSGLLEASTLPGQANIVKIVAVNCWLPRTDQNIGHALAWATWVAGFAS